MQSGLNDHKYPPVRDLSGSPGEDPKWRQLPLARSKSKR